MDGHSIDSAYPFVRCTPFFESRDFDLNIYTKHEVTRLTGTDDSQIVALKQHSPPRGGRASHERALALPQHAVCSPWCSPLTRRLIARLGGSCIPRSRPLRTSRSASLSLSRPLLDSLTGHGDINIRRVHVPAGVAVPVQRNSSPHTLHPSALPQCRSISTARSLTRATFPPDVPMPNAHKRHTETHDSYTHTRKHARTHAHAHTG